MGPPEVIQKFHLRKWPISSADFPMTPMERTKHHFGAFGEKDFGAISGGPFFSRPLCFTADNHDLSAFFRPLLTLVSPPLGQPLSSRFALHALRAYEKLFSETLRKLFLRQNLVI